MRRLLVLVFVAVATVVVAPAAGAVTGAPSLTSPVASTTYGHTFTVSYVLPDTPAAGTVRLRFIAGSTCTLTMNNNPNPSFTLDTTSVVGGPVAATDCASIPDGTYTVVVSYQNAALDPVATASAAGVVISGAGPTTTTTTTAPTTTTTTPATTSTAPSTTATGVTPTTSAPAGVTPTTVDPSAVRNANDNQDALAATGTRSALPGAAVGVGLLLVGAGLLHLRLRRTVR